MEGSDGGGVLLWFCLGCPASASVLFSSFRFPFLIPFFLVFCFFLVESLDLGYYLYYMPSYLAWSTGFLKGWRVLKKDKFQFCRVVRSEGT